jgi:hypothetical protein
VITIGYIGGPPATGTAIQATPVSGLPGTVVLGQQFWPVDTDGVLGPRPSFDGQPVPFSVRAGTALTLSRSEVVALLAAGLASAV